MLSISISSYISNQTYWNSLTTKCLKYWRKHEKQYYMPGWLYKTALGAPWGREPNLGSSEGWNSNIEAAVLWAPSNPRWPRGFILIAVPSGNRRPSFGPGQCGKLNQRTLSRARNHTDCTFREKENRGKI